MARTLTNHELLTLRAFARQFQRLRECSIIKQGELKLSLTTKLDMMSGEVTGSFTGYDTELFHAALPIFRQFLLNDDVSFDRIHNIINQCCERQPLLDWTRYAKRKWDEKLASLPDQVHRHFHVTLPTVENALQKVFYGYGGLFHVDVNAPEEETSIVAIQNWMMHHAFPFLCSYLNIVDTVIVWWQDAPTESVPAVPTE